MDSDHGPERKELKAQWKTHAQVPTLGMSDVAKHKTKNDLWIVIHGKIYDVTKYSKDHPGGPDTLLESGGKDATSDYEGVGHSEDAREIMKPFLVGELEGAQESEKPAVAAAPQVIRPPSSKPKSDDSQKSRVALTTPQIELAAFAVTTIGLVGIVAHFASGSKSSDFLAGTFTHGFALASAICAAVGVMAFRYLSKSLEMGPSFSSYPSHVPISNVVAPTDRARGVLIQSEYQKFPLIKKDELAKDIFRFVFALPKQSSVLGLPTGQHVAIRGYWDDDSGHHTVVRSYTPVSNNSDRGRLELLIRCYPDGQLTGKYLSHLTVGDEVEFRGPTGVMKYRKGLSQRIGMVAGGTGITPMYQLIRVICEDKTDKTQVSLIYANRSEDDILMRKQLDRFAANSGKFKVYYMLDHPPKAWAGGTGFVNKQVIQERLPAASDETKMLLCGPPGMVNATKKNLVELGFKAPGAVSRLTDQIFCF